LYADALTHELAEMTVDPAADLSNSEVCDPCAGNCNVRYDNFFDKNRNWLGGQRVTGYAFFTNGVVLPKDANACPAPVASCSYAPPGTSPTPPPPTPSPTPPPPTPANPCIAQIDKGVLEVTA